MSTLGGSVYSCRAYWPTGRRLPPNENVAPALLEFDADRVIAARVDVLDRVRALGLHEDAV